MYVWTKLSSEKQANAWEARLNGNDRVTLVITSVPGKRSIRLDAYCEQQKDADGICAQYGGSVHEVKEQNWAAMSDEPMPPIKVREAIVVVSARTPKEIAKARTEFDGRQVIAVPADMAFGTGHHATTATVLRMLVDAAEELKGKRWTMADLGCGSGILAIAADKLGAAKVWGCDFDAKAVEISKVNALRNDAPTIRFTQTDVLKWEPKEEYDVVIANIFFDILHAGFPQIVRSVKVGGVLMVSGILNTQADQCLAAAEACGVTWDRIVKKGKWVSARGVCRARVPDSRPAPRRDKRKRPR